MGLSLETRKRLFQNAWPPKELLHHRENVDEKALRQLARHIQNESSSGINGRLRAALVLSGVDEANHRTILQSLGRRFEQEDHNVNGHAPQKHADDRVQASTSQGVRNVLVDLKAQQCTNLQVALKNLVKIAVTEATDPDVYQNFLAKRKKLLPLNFDLDLLAEFCHQHDNIRIIVSLSDVESFSNHVLNELISTLNIWKDNVPLFLLLGIASTRELFEQRLSRSCLRLLDAKQFHFNPSTNTQSNLLRKLQMHSERGSDLTFDHTALSAMNDVCHSQGNSTKSLEQMLKLVYASYNLVNPLAGLVDIAGVDEHEIRAITEAARRADSFKDYCARLLQRKGKHGDHKIRLLMESESHLLQEIMEQTMQGRQQYNNALEAIYFLADLYEVINLNRSGFHKARLEVEARLLRSLSSLRDCDVYVEIREKLQDMQPQEILTFLDQIESNIKTSSLEYYASFTINDRDILEQEDTAILRNSSKAKSKQSIGKKQSEPLMSFPDNTQTRSSTDRILNKAEFLDFLEHLVEKNTMDTSKLLLHESYIIQNRSLRLKQYFESNPRAALERALTSPGDYLGCGCCNTSSKDSSGPQDNSTNGIGTETGSMPPASILFILLQEAPSIINVRDLYDAFESRLQESQPDGESVSTTVMMLFYRALAEMKMLGLVKESAGTQQVKRKAKASKAAAQDADFVAKTSWAGL